LTAGRARLGAVLLLGLVLVAVQSGRLVRGQEPSPKPAPPVATSLILFAGSPAGLWRSNNWGGTWERVTVAPVKDCGPVHGILAVSSRVYLAAEAGLFISDDFGQTWAATGLTRPAHAVLPSRYPQSDPTLFVGTADGLLKSEDAGRSFKPTPLRGMSVTHLEWPGPALVVGTAKGVRVSVDAAESFGAPGTGLPEGAVGALALSSYYPVDPVLFVSVGSQGVFRSGDGARTWAPAGLSGQAVSDLVWLGPVLYATSDQGFQRSVDGGRTWLRTSEGLPKELQPRRLLFPLAPDSGAEAFLATNRGVFRTADGGERWMEAGLRGESVSCVSTFPPPSETTLGKKKKR
jgi:photosystem II stability/assembly factor-like uncharacterized protein